MKRRHFKRAFHGDSQLRHLAAELGKRIIITLADLNHLTAVAVETLVVELTLKSEITTHADCHAYSP